MRKLMMWGEKEKPTKKNTDGELKTLEEYMKEKEVIQNGRNKENNHK